MMYRKCVIGLLAALISFAALGKDDPSKEPAVKMVTDPGEFKTLVADLQKEMETGGRYQFVKPDERRRVNADFDKIARLLEKQAGGARLNQDEIAQQITAQNEANAIFHQRDGERLVCERVKPIGSNVPVTSCNTYAELQRIHDSSQEYLRLEQKTSPGLQAH